MNAILTIVIFLALLPNAISYGAPYYEGRMRVTFRDSARGKDIPVTIIYPADSSSGDNRPLVGTGTNAIPTFGIVVIGHGYQMPVTAYKTLATSICQNNGKYIVVLPETGSGLFPSHNDFALDMVSACTYMQSEGKRKGAMWYGHIANDNVLAGHSMGGGAALLAAKQILQTKVVQLSAVISMAPAETNPSSSAAATFVTVPTLIVAGSVDCVTPLASTVQPIYNNVVSTCKTLAVIPGASHCQFADANSACNLGELNCKATISREAQLARAWQYVNHMLQRNDSVTSTIADTEVQTTYVGITAKDIVVSATQACTGDTVMCRYSGAATNILWLPDSVRSATYSIVARDSSIRVSLVNTTCFGTARFDTVISIYQRPTVRIDGPSVFCPGDSIVLQAITNSTVANPMSIQWSNGATSSRIVVRQPGVYTATAKSTRGCGASSAIRTVDVVSLPTVYVRIVGDTVHCDDKGQVEAELQGDVQLVEGIRWSTGDTTRRVIIRDPGTYPLYAEMRMRGEYSCPVVSDTQTITLRHVTATTPLVSYRIDTLWSTPASEYQWLKESNPIQDARQVYFVPKASGSYSVRTTMPGEWGCSGVSKPLDVSVSSTKDFSTTPTVIFDTPTLRLRLQSPGRSISVYSTGGLLVYLFESQSMIDYATLSLPPIAYGVYAVVVDGEWIGNFLNY